MSLKIKDLIGTMSDHGRLPTIEEWIKLKNKISKEIRGFSEIVIDKDVYDIEFMRVNYSFDIPSNIQLKIKQLDNITEVEELIRGFSIVLNICPLCTKKDINLCIKSLKRVPSIIKAGM